MTRLSAEKFARLYTAKHRDLSREIAIEEIDRQPTRAERRRNERTARHTE